MPKIINHPKRYEVRPTSYSGDYASRCDCGAEIVWSIDADRETCPDCGAVFSYVYDDYSGTAYRSA